MAVVDAQQLFLNRAKALSFEPNKIWSDVVDSDEKELDELLRTYSLQMYKNSYQYNKLAGALRMYRLYRTAHTTIDGYLGQFAEFLRDDVVEFIREHEETLYDALDFSKDFNYGNLAAATMVNNYLSRESADKPPTEIPQFMVMRLAVGSSLKRGIEFVCKTIELYNKRLLSFASPTIYNMGFKKGAPTSCMVLTVDDDLEDIYNVIGEIAMASKNNAGIGLALGRLRNSEIGRSGKSKGVMPLLKILDHSTEYVNQGGRRPGATTVTLPIWHLDIFEFIHCRDNIVDESIQVKTLNTSVMMNDLFMERLEEKGDWYAMCPNIAKGLADSHFDKFRDLYLKYEQMAIRWNQWEFYQNLLKVYSENPEKVYEQLYAVMKEFESEVYVHFWLYKHIKSQKVKSPSDELFLKAHEEKNEAFIKRERLEKLRGKKEAVRSTKQYVINSKFVKKQKQIVMTPEEQEELDELEEEVSHILIPDPCEAPPKFRNKKYKAADLMDLICKQQRRSGMPYINQSDTINRMSPNQNVGFIYSLNLCQEIALPTIPREHTATCNIASICLKRMWTWNDQMEVVVDYNKIADAVRHLTLVLNDILDQAVNIQAKAIASNYAIRPIGIGVNGWAELMYKLDLSTADHSKVDTSLPVKQRYRKRMHLNPVTEDIIHNIWSCIYYNGLRASCDEALRTEPYAEFWTSDYVDGILHFNRYENGKFRHEGAADPKLWNSNSWDHLIADIREYGLRNSTVTTQMPTATSAQILEASEATELSQNLVIRRLKIGDFPVQNYHLIHDLEKINLWNKNTYNILTASNGSILEIPEENLEPEQLKRLQFLKTKYQSVIEVQQSLRIQEEAIRQKFTDQARSFTLYVADPREEILTAAHKNIWKSGLKSSYYIRSRAVIRNMKFKSSVENDEDEYDDNLCEGCSS